MDGVATGYLLLVGFLLVGLMLGILYGALALTELRHVRRVPTLTGTSAGVGADVPTRRFRGEVWEERWQGSQGYARPPDDFPTSWVGRLLLPAYTPLRPSRFHDHAYWTRYLPGVAAVWIGFFVVLPLLLYVIVEPTSGTLTTFTPTAAQRAALRQGPSISQPPACPGPAPAGTSGSVQISPADDGTVVAVPAGERVQVAYYYGPPAYSPDIPLCSTGPPAADGRVDLLATSGTGFVYIPQPTGTIVAQVTVTRSHLTTIGFLVVLGVAILVADVVLTTRLRRSVRARYS